MKRLLISLILAAVLLTGCASKASVHTVHLDELTFTLPDTFTDLSQDTAEGTGQAFMYVQDRMYINGYKESKQELEEYYETLSLSAYVRMFSENHLPESEATQTDGIWNITYTTAIEDADYTFLCVFYETHEGFWRIQACCPSEQFAANQQLMWDYIASAH